jgi:hypothetical protein
MASCSDSSRCTVVEFWRNRGSSAVVVDLVAEPGKEEGKRVVSGGDTPDENDVRAASDAEKSRLSVGREAVVRFSSESGRASGSERCGWGGTGSGSSGGGGM